MEVSREVANAVAMGYPVVALETTLVTHGLPYPDNINIAREMEEIVRSNDVIPATIGVLDGKIYVGMSNDQLEQLADTAHVGKAVKISRRDLAHTISQEKSGGTTVAATMMCAERAGVQIFVTGGLGGVHRGGETTMDVSADVVELGRTPVAVVCAGIKSILDIGRSLEVLETEGVAVATLGESPDFPAFFSRSSGYKAPFCVESETAAARLIDVSLCLGVGSGVVIAVPIPEELSAEGREVEEAIQLALQAAESEGIKGKEVTPYVLQRVNQLTGGKSLQANVSLLRHNADIGSRIASHLARLRSSSRRRHSSYPGDHYRHAADSEDRHTGHQQRAKSSSHKKLTKSYDLNSTPVVVGASILDFVIKVSSPEIKSEGTNPGSMHQSSGGVARNIAECMCRCGTPPFFVSAVGDDDSGRSLGSGLGHIGMSLSGVLISPSHSTASYCVMLNSHGELVCGVGDMDIHSTISPDWVERFESRLASAPIVCMDGNIPVETLQYICDVCHRNNVPVWFEPTGPDKASALLHDGVLDRVNYTSPNLAELRSIHGCLVDSLPPTKPHITDLTVEEKLTECGELIPSLLDHVPHVLASLGRDGVVWGERREGGESKLSHFTACGRHSHTQPVSVSGAGDSFVGAMLSSLVGGFPHDKAIKAGLRAASLSIVSLDSVSPAVTPRLFSEAAIETWAPWQPQEINLSL
jgi:pseudouridine-5'-phosphate glycosidase/pseudouridine kinase